jgi:death-on-curing protein
LPITDHGTVYLTADDIVEIHLGLAQEFARAGRPFEVGVNREKLEAAVSQPRQWFGGVELYADLLAKAAALARGIICGHVFLDGNKRTGMEAAMLFLEYNGSAIRLPTYEYIALGLAIAGDRATGIEPIGIEEIADRLTVFATREPG